MSPVTKARKAAGWSFEQLAAKAGVSRLTIIKLEKGCSHTVKAGTLWKVAKALKITPDVIFKMIGRDERADGGA